MGRPPSNGGPSFRFNAIEVGEMEAILLAHDLAVPGREIIDALAQRFSAGAERAGKVEISFKQVLNWFQNRRYALRARAAKTAVPGETNASPMPRDNVVNVPQAPQPHHAPLSVKSAPHATHIPPAQPVQSAGRNASDTSPMEYEAKSARDGAWYDVTYFLSYRSLGTGDPLVLVFSTKNFAASTKFLVENTSNSHTPVMNKEALVRFAGFGPEEDEWVNIRKHVRQRSLPCEASECVAVLPGDLALCFQEGKEQALYFDAHVLDAQRRRHDVRGCRCRFLVRYDHDDAEEIVPLRKICRRPETDYRLQLLHAMPMDMNPQKETGGVDPQVRPMPKIDESTGQTSQSPPEEEHVDSGVTPANVPMPLPEIKPEMLLSS